MPELPIVVLGMPAAVPEVDLLVGGRRHLDGLPGRHLVIGGDLGPVLDGIGAEPGRVCVLASGDPGFFGIVRALADRFGPHALDVRPAPSSVSLFGFSAAVVAMGACRLMNSSAKAR